MKYSHFEVLGDHAFMEQSGEGTGDDLTECDREKPLAVSRRSMCLATT